MKECYMQCGVLKSNEDMILALAGQFKQLSHEPFDNKMNHLIIKIVF